MKVKPAGGGRTCQPQTFTLACTAGAKQSGSRLHEGGEDGEGVKGGDGAGG